MVTMAVIGYNGGWHQIREGLGQAPGMVKAGELTLEQAHTMMAALKKKAAAKQL